MVLERMLKPKPYGWGMPRPMLTVSTMSQHGNHCHGHQTVNSAPPPSFSIQQGTRGFQQTDRNSWLGDYYKKPAGWNKWPPMWADTNPDGSSPKFEQRVSDLMYGITRATTEANGWLLSRQAGRHGANETGAVADVGVRKYKHTQPHNASNVVNVGMTAVRGSGPAQTWRGEFKTAEEMVQNWNWDSGDDRDWARGTGTHTTWEPDGVDEEAVKAKKKRWATALEKYQDGLEVHFGHPDFSCRFGTFL